MIFYNIKPFGIALLAACSSLAVPFPSRIVYAEESESATQQVGKIETKVNRSVGGLESMIDKSAFKQIVDKKGKYKVDTGIIITNPGAAITLPLTLLYSLCFDYQDRISCVDGKTETLESGLPKKGLYRKIHLKQRFGEARGRAKITVQLEKGKESLYWADHYLPNLRRNKK